MIQPTSTDTRSQNEWLAPRGAGHSPVWLGRMLLMALGMMLVASACQGGVPSDPQSVHSCDRLVDVAVGSARELITASADLTQPDFDTATPAAVAVQQQYRERTDAIAQRAEELDCDNQALLDTYRKRMLKLPPETEGGAPAQQLALLRPPFKTAQP